MEEIVLEESNLVEGLGKILSYCGVGKIILRDYKHCPRCGSLFVSWDPSRRRHRCTRKTCPWEEGEETLPLRSGVTGGPLRAKEILKMIFKSL